MPENATQHKNRSAGRKPRRWLKRILTLLTIIILLTALAPWVVSMFWGPGIMESVVNDMIKGRISVKNVSLSWIGDVELEGIEMFDPEDRKVLATDRITLKKSLLGLITSWENLNELEVRGPKLWLYVDKKGEISLARAVEMRAAPDPTAPAAPLPPLRGVFKIIDGESEIITHDDQRNSATFSGQCTLETLNDIKLAFNVATQDAGGLKAQLDILNLAPNGLIDLDNLSVAIDTETVSPINLATAAKLAGQKGIAGTGTMKLDGKFAEGKFDGQFAAAVLKFAASEKALEKAKPIDMKLSGKISAGEKDISGAIELAAQTAGSASLEFNYKLPGDDWSLDPGKLLEAVAKGRMLELPEFTITSNAELDVARLAAAAPDLLKIRSDAKLQELNVKLTDASASGGKRPAVSAKVSIGQARAIVDGQPVVWKPTTALLKIQTDADGLLQIDNVDVNVGQGLVSVKTSGTATEMTLEANARLAELRQQLSQIFDLKNLVLTGNIHLAGSIQRPKQADQKDTAKLDVDMTARAESVEYRPDSTSDDGALAIDTQAAWKASLVQAGDDVSATGRLDLAKLSFTFDGKQIKQDAATIDHDVTFNQKNSDVALRKLKLNSAQATLDVSGTVRGLKGENPQLDVTGNYAAELALLAPIVKLFEPKLAASLETLKNADGSFSLKGGAEELSGQAEIKGRLGELKAIFAFSRGDGKFDIDVQKLLDAAWAGKPISLPDVTLQADGNLQPAVLLAAARPFMDKSDLDITAGRIDLIGVRIRGGAQPSALGEIRLTDLAGASAKRPFKLEPTKVLLRAATDKDGRLTSADATVDLGSAGSATMRNKPTESTLEAAFDLGALAAQLSNFVDMKGAGLSGVMHANIKASREKPGDTRASIKAVVKADKAHYAPAKPSDTEPMTFSGQADWTGTADYSKQTIAATGKAVLQGILLKIGDKQIRQDQASLDHDVTVDLDKSNAAITKLELTSDPAAFSLSGKIEQFDKKPIVDVAGKYAIAWAELTPIIRQLAPDLPETLASLAKTSGTFELADSGQLAKGQFSLSGQVAELKGQFSAAHTKEPIGAIIERAVDAVVASKPLTLPEISLSMNGHILCAPALTAIGPLVELPKDLKLTGGRIEISSLSFQGGSKPKLATDILVSGLAGSRAGKPVKLDDITVLATARLDNTNRLRIEKAVFSSGFAQANASGSIGNFTLKANADLPKLKSQLDPFLDMQATLAGSITLDATIKKVGDSYDNLDASVNAQAKDFQYVPKPPAGAKTKPASLKPRTFTITSNALVNLKTDVIRITTAEAKFQPELLTVNLGGNVSKIKSQWTLDLAGTYSGQWEEINRLMEELSPGATETIALAGKTSGKFIATGALANPEVTTTDDGLSGNTVLAWDKGNALGLPLGQGKISPKLSKNRLVLPVSKFSASEGTVQIGATVDMSGKEPVLRLPPTLQVMDEVQLTQKFSKEVLSRVNPIFAGLGYIRGKAALRLDGVEIPMGESMNTGGKGTGRLDLSDMRVKPSGILTQLLKWQGVPTEVDYYTVDVSGMDFLVRKGGIEYDNFTFTFPKDLKIGFSGRVGFDDTVEMKVFTPVTAALLNKLGVSGPTTEYARVLKGARIAIPMSGTRKLPKLDLSRVDVKPLIKKAAENLLKEKAGGLLRDRLFPKLKIP